MGDSLGEPLGLIEGAILLDGEGVGTPLGLGDGAGDSVGRSVGVEDGLGVVGAEVGEKDGAILWDGCCVFVGT